MNSDQEHGAERAKQVFDKELQIVRAERAARQAGVQRRFRGGASSGPYCTRRAGTELVTLNGNYAR